MGAVQAQVITMQTASNPAMYNAGAAGMPPAGACATSCWLAGVH